MKFIIRGTFRSKIYCAVCEGTLPGTPARPCSGMMLIFQFDVDIHITVYILFINFSVFMYLCYRKVLYIM